MARLFRLAGLLRLRHLQQDQAASQLALANGRMRENNFRQMRARTALGSTLTEVANTAALHAVAAARAATRSTLADLEAVGVEVRAEVGHAQAAFDAARSRAVRLEKLEDRHAEAVAMDDTHREQASLDEIASGAWHRHHEGAEE